MIGPDDLDNTDSGTAAETTNGFQPTSEQRTGAQRTAILLVILVAAMIVLATLSRMFGW
jgi:hypothetical protein